MLYLNLKIASAVSYGMLELLTAFILANEIRIYLEKIDQNQKSEIMTLIEKTPINEYLKAFINYLVDNGKNLIEIKDVNDFQKKYNIHVLFFIFLALTFILEAIISKYIGNNEKYENIENILSDHFFEKTEFLEFIHDNIFLINYDAYLQFIFITKNILILMILLYFLYQENYIEKNTTKYIVGFFAVIIAFGIWLGKSKKFDLDTNDSLLLLNIVNEFQESKKNYSKYFLYIYLILFFVNIYAMSVEKINIFNLLILIYFLIYIIFALKSVISSYKDGKNLKQLIDLIPINNQSYVTIPDCDKIICNQSNLNIFYSSYNISVLTDFDFTLELSKMYIIKTNHTTQLLEHMLQSNKNNPNVFMCYGNQNFAISSVINYDKFCKIFDTNTVPMNLISESKYILEPSKVKYQNLSIILEAISSSYKFIGINGNLFNEFTEIEKQNILELIGSNQSLNKSIVLITENDLNTNNAFSFVVNNGKIEPTV